MVQIRPMDQADLAAVMAVQVACYPLHFHEPLVTLSARLQACPQTAWVATWAGQVCGYVVGYRSRYGWVAPLGSGFIDHPSADCGYLHDLAILPNMTGQGVAAQLLAAYWTSMQADRLSYSALVSVQDSQFFWQRYGYQPTSLPTEGARLALSSYGEGAVYMVKALADMSIDLNACIES